MASRLTGIGPKQSQGCLRPSAPWGLRPMDKFPGFGTLPRESE